MDKIKSLLSVTDKGEFVNLYKTFKKQMIDDFFKKEFGMRYVDISEFRDSEILRTVFDESTLDGIDCFAMYAENKIVFVVSDIDNLNKMKEYVKISGYSEKNILMTFDIFLHDALKSKRETGSIVQGEMFKLVNGSVHEKILLATGIDKIDSVIEMIPNYNVVGKLEYKEDMFKAVKEKQPDIIITSDNLGGKSSFFNELILIKSEFKNIRIIVLNGSYPQDEIALNNIGVLVNLGVYDIYFQEKMSIEFFGYILDNPKTKDDVKDFTKEVKDRGKFVKKTNNKIDVYVSSDERIEMETDSHVNLYSFYNTSGGTGSTTLALNTAFAINRYGLKPEGKQNPNVLLIDLDFVNQSLTACLNKFDPEKNITNAIEIAKGIVSETGEVSANNHDFLNAIEKIEGMIIQVDPKGVFLLSGNSQSFKCLDDKVPSVYVSFLIDVLVSKFDVVIVDVADDIHFSRTYEAISLSRYAFNVLDLSYKSLNSYKRTLNYLSNILNLNKHKLVLNKYYENEIYQVSDLQKIGIDINFTIDETKLSVLNESMHKNKPAILNGDSELDGFKRDLFILANIMYPIKNINKVKEMKKEMIKAKDDTKEGRISKFFDFLLGGN